jgi:uncharacterized protein YjdB
MRKFITKKILLLFTACIFISMNMRAQVERVSLNRDTITLAVGGAQETLTATVYLNGTGNDSVRWINDYSSIVEIDTVMPATDKDCIVKATGKGEAKVIVETIEGNYRDTCVVQVVAPVTGMEIKDGDAMTAHLGRDTFLVAHISPPDVTNDSVVWESRDSSVVNLISTEENRYDTICTIRPLKPGSAWIVARTADGDFKDSCEVTVTAEPIQQFSLSDDTIDLYVNDETAVIAQIRPLEGTDLFVYWNVNDGHNSNIYRRTDSGYDTICKIRATGVGTAKLVAETRGRSLKDTCIIRVRAVRVDTMYMKTDTLYLDNKYHRDTVLIATIAPSDATNKSVTFTSSRREVADIISVEQDTICHIQVGYSGETTIYAETADGNFKDSCYIKVTVPVDSIVLRAEVYRNGSYVPAEIKNSDGQKVIDEINILSDSIARLTAVVYPDTATAYKPLRWHNLDTDLMKIDSVKPASVDTVCYITARMSGVDTVYVTAADGSASSNFYFIRIPFRQADSIKINVTDERIVDKDTILLNVRDSYELVTTVYPWNVSNDTLTWEITGTADVIRVDSAENRVLLNGLKPGEATLYAWATDGSLRKDSFIVKVRSVPVAGMTLSADTVYIYENNVDSIYAVISPANATNKRVSWSSSDQATVRVETSADTMCTFRGLKADTAVIRAEIDGMKDSCAVIVKEQFVFVEPGTNDGKIALYLKLPDDDITFTGSFELQLPQGFGLTLDGNGGYRTALEAAYSESSDLSIVRLNDSTYTFTVTLKVSPASTMLRAASSKKKVMDIAYTVYNDDLLENSEAVYDVKVVKADFKRSDGTEIKEDHTARIKAYKDETGNEIVGDRNLHVYIADNYLYVRSAKAETVSVYSLTGSLLLSKDKAEGQAAFLLPAQEKILIVKGSSGWAQKVLNR